MEVTIGKAKLSIVQGDISQISVDVIVNSANDKLWMGSGVAGAIKKAGGEEIELEAMKKGPIPIGDVVLTEAGNLPAKKVIHAVVMGQDLQTNAEYIRKAVKNTIKAADSIPAESLAMPAFGTGIGHFPAEECSEIMVEEAVEGLLNAANLRRLNIILKDPGIYEIFKHALEAKFSHK